MNSRTTASFWKAYAALSADVKESAREAYRRFLENPQHPGLRFKRVHPTEPIYSVRITRDHRAVGVLVNDGILWFWIGGHDEYLHVIRHTR